MKLSFVPVRKGSRFLTALLLVGAAHVGFAQDSFPAGSHTDADKDLKHAEKVQKHAEKVQKHAEKVQKHVEKAMQEVERNMAQVEYAMSMAQQAMDRQMARLPGTIAQAQKDVVIPKIPPIPPIPPIPALPKMPDVGQMSRDFEGEVVSDLVDQAFSVDASTELHVESSFGSVTILQATQPGTMNVTVEKMAGAKTREEARKLLENLRVTVRQDQNHVYVSFEPGDNKDEEGQKMQSAHIRVITPPLAQVHSQTSFGSTLVQGIQAAFDLKSEFGAVSLENCSGSLTVDCQYGNVTLDRHQGNLNLDVEFGPIQIEGCSGTQHKISLQYGQALLKGLSRDVQIEGDFSFSPVELYLPKDFGGTFELSNSMGPINIPKEITVEKSGEEDADDEENAFVPKEIMEMEKSIKGSFGQGDGRIKIENEFGPVSIFFDKDNQ